LAINGGTRNLFGKTGCESGITGYVESLFSYLHHTTYDNIFNYSGIDPGTLH
jgi:hypothetical protein